MENQLNRRKHEAIETLQAEGVHVESWFHVELDGLDYLIAYTRADDIAKAHEVSKKVSLQSIKYISNLNALGKK